MKMHDPKILNFTDTRAVVVKVVLLQILVLWNVVLCLCHNLMKFCIRFVFLERERERERVIKKIQKSAKKSLSWIWVRT